MIIIVIIVLSYGHPRLGRMTGSWPNYIMLPLFSVQADFSPTPCDWAKPLLAKYADQHWPAITEKPMFFFYWTLLCSQNGSDPSCQELHKTSEGIWHLARYSLSPISCTDPWLELVCAAHFTDAWLDWGLGNLEVKLNLELIFYKPFLNNCCNLAERTEAPAIRECHCHEGVYFVCSNV